MPHPEPAAGRTLLMGVLNVTPDSFSDGGRFLDPDDAVRHGLQLLADGADVLDVGAESTRPGYRPVPAEQQIARAVPVIERLRARTAAPISIDTTRAAVARAAVAAGATWINDTTALRDDPALGDVAAGLVAAEPAARVVLMHRFDPPRAAHDASDPVAAVASGLRLAVERAQRYGVPPAALLLDPGIGFGTRADDAVELLARLGELREIGRPLLVGPSRKSFLGALTGRGPGERELATAAVVALLVRAGVEVVRVHDVAAMRDVKLVVEAVCAREER